MILTVKFDRLIKTKDNSFLSFEVPLWQSNFELDKDKNYKLEITEVKSKRSLRQNNLMWSVINKIAIVTGMSDDDVYCQIVELSNIKANYIQSLPEIQKDLEKVFRVVKKVEERMSNDVLTYVFKCYYGTSKFDTKEMTDFINQLLHYAHEVGVDVREFENMY